MSWQDQFIAPQRESPPNRRIRYPCPGLCRFAGMVSFIVVALGIYYGGTALFGLEPLNWNAPSWTAKHVGLVIAGIVFGLIAGLFGFGGAMTIKVRSERLNTLFITLWQFLAIGGMVWILVIGTAMSVSLGGEESREAIMLFGAERASLHVIATGCVLGLLMGFAFFIAPIIHLPVVGYLAFAVTTSLLAARWHYGVYDIAGTAWVVAGLITPTLVLVFAPSMIARDQQQRRLILEQLS